MRARCLIGLALVLALAGAAAGLGAAHSGTYPLGFVVWHCSQPEPVMYLREDVVGSEIEGAVRAHEEDHLRQIEGLACEEYLTLLQDPEWRLASEASAFCATALHEYRRGAYPSLGVAVARYAIELAGDYYRFGITPREAALLIAAHCRERI